MNIVDNTERNKRICELRGKMSASLIAERVGCSRNAVIGVWNRAGLSSPNGRKGIPAPKSNGPKYVDPSTKRLMIDIASKRSITYAAQAYGFHPSTIWKWCRNAGVRASW